MRRNLNLRKEVLTELVDSELESVAGAVPPPTIPETYCTICQYPTLGKTCICPQTI
jgi:hypothetical protein